jgi:hypothetical protein
MESGGRLKLNKYSLPAMIYFCFNGIGMPAGLLIMNLFTPFFYLYLLFRKKKEILHRLLIFLLPFDIIHLLLGVGLKSFLISNLLFISTYIFTWTFAEFVSSYTGLQKLFRLILLWNFIFTLVACVVFFTPWKETMWYINKFTASVDQFPRLAMFTYEASYYSLMFVPIAYYYLLKVFFGKNKTNQWIILLFVSVPLALSFSLGVLGATALTFMIMYTIHWQKVFYRKNFLNVLMFVLIVVSVGTLLLLIAYPDNPLFVRLGNIFSGVDTSANGRTTDSYTMAYRIAAERSLVFGSGLGQIKELAPEIVQKYYNYWGELDVVRIPNAMAETLAIFGFAGVFLRIAICIYFFFRTQVLNNYYRTALFLFVFIYQFTGSYVTNMVEYVIWGLAFTRVFPEFNVKHR